MKYFFSVVLFLYTYIFLSAQVNLVPNPSFEDYGTCPTGISAFYFSTDTYVSQWFSGNASTTDYLNACAAAPTSVSVPANLFSDDQPAHTGQAYAGFWCDLYDDGSYNYREYASAQLTEPLIAGECYYVEFWSAPATQSDMGSGHATTDRLGAYFSADHGFSFETGVLGVTPQIDNVLGNYISEPGSWTRICGFFEADGGENWITLGNFHTDAETDVVAYDGGTLTASPLVYLFVDDVLVSPIDSVIASVLNDTIVCSPFTLSAFNCSGASYLWSTGDTTSSITVYESGDYWLQLNTGCGVFADTAHITFVVDSVYTSASDTTICFTQLPFTINASAAYDYYNWNTGDTTASIAITEDGTYYVSGFTDCANFIDTFNIHVTEPLTPNLNLGNDTLICSDAWTLQLNSVPVTGNYIWNTGDTTQNITINNAGTYWVHIETACESFSDTITITEDPNLNVTIDLGDDKELCPPANISSFNLTATEGLPNYTWSTGETTSAITVTEPGLYYVTSNLLCNTISDSVRIGLCNNIYVPNAFSPNGDGINDFLQVIVVDPSKIISFNIYNRWGEIVYAGNASAYTWDGTFNNAEQSMGVYVYILTYFDENGARQMMQGNVTLVK